MHLSPRNFRKPRADAIATASACWRLKGVFAPAVRRPSLEAVENGPASIGSSVLPTVGQLY